MHIVLLSEPFACQPRRGHNSIVTLDFATETGNEQTICGKFSQYRGCNLDKCEYAHVCNGRFSGKACLLPHPGFQHFSFIKS